MLLLCYAIHTLLQVTHFLCPLWGTATSTISRESIVKRIKAYAGETYSFEDFVKNDKRDAGIVESRAFGGNGDQRTSGTYQHAPVFHKGSPLKMAKVRKHR